MRGRGVRCALALLCALAGCRHLGAAAPYCSGESARPGALAPRTLHVRAELARDGDERRHEAVIEVEAERIVLVGLTPLGTRAFVVEAGAHGLAIDEGIGRRLGLSPRLLYDAVARAYLAPPSPDAEPEPRALVSVEAGGVTRVSNPRCGYEAKLVLVAPGR
jgi:hypothetical protein